jgi:hypothetical protein
MPPNGQPDGPAGEESSPGLVPEPRERLTLGRRLHGPMGHSHIFTVAVYLSFVSSGYCLRV